MPDAKPASSTAYHHGNLRAALLEAAVHLAEEGGPENVSVREVAKRVGVSPGAPFRHFSSKTALMTAVAEDAMSRFRAEITVAVEAVADGDALGRYAAVGFAFLRWAVQNPTHFQIISTRSLIDWSSSQALQRDNEAIRALMEEALLTAQQDGLLRSGDLAEAQIAGRALVYGLARMYIDGHFAQWGVEGERAEQTAQNALKFFIALMADR